MKECVHLWLVRFRRLLCTQSEMLQDLWESREESVGPGESHASSGVLLISFEMLAIATIIMKQ